MFQSKYTHPLVRIQIAQQKETPQASQMQMFSVVAITAIAHSLDNRVASRPLGPHLVSDVREQNHPGVQLGARCWWALLEGL